MTRPPPNQLAINLEQEPEPEDFAAWVHWTRNPQNNPQIRRHHDSPERRTTRPARHHPAKEKQTTI